MVTKIFVTNSSEGTVKLAKNIAMKLKGGEIIALYGDLGAGKTTFVKGLAQGLGIEQRITSPTFIIQNVHNLKNEATFYHFDFYRLEKVDSQTEESVKEAFSQSKGISAVEWSERIEHLLPKKTKRIKLENLGLNKRRITING